MLLVVPFGTAKNGQLSHLGQFCRKRGTTNGHEWRTRLEPETRNLELPIDLRFWTYPTPGYESETLVSIDRPWESAESVKKPIDSGIALDERFAELILAMCFLGTILCAICKDLRILVEKDPILEPEFSIYVCRKPRPIGFAGSVVTDSTSV